MTTDEILALYDRGEPLLPLIDIVPLELRGLDPAPPPLTAVISSMPVSCAGSRVTCGIPIITAANGRGISTVTCPSDTSLIFPFAFLCSNLRLFFLSDSFKP